MDSPHLGVLQSLHFFLVGVLVAHMGFEAPIPDVMETSEDCRSLHKKLWKPNYSLRASLKSKHGVGKKIMAWRQWRSYIFLLNGQSASWHRRAPLLQKLSLLGYFLCLFLDPYGTSFQKPLLPQFGKWGVSERHVSILIDIQTSRQQWNQSAGDARRASCHVFNPAGRDGMVWTAGVLGGIFWRSYGEPSGSWTNTYPWKCSNLQMNHTHT